MAERRMFSKEITDGDEFIELPSSAQILYFHLNQSADDDGFNNQIKNALFKAHATDEDLNMLIDKNLIIKFRSGVIAITHWKMHNYIRKDRYKPTAFQNEFGHLKPTTNGKYIWQENSGCQTVDGWLTQDRLVKDSLDKVSPEIYSSDENRTFTNDYFENDCKNSISNTNSEFEEEFETLWKKYPVKQGKKEARDKYIKLRKENKVSFETVNSGIERYVNYINEFKIENQYIKHGCNFFKQECWNNPCTVVNGQNKSSSIDIAAFEKMLDAKDD